MPRTAAPCVLCDQLPEKMHHITIACPYSRHIWHEVLSWLRLPCQPPCDEANLTDWWIDAHKSLPKPMPRGLDTVALLTPWMIWKQRNDCVKGRCQRPKGCVANNLGCSLMMFYFLLVTCKPLRRLVNPYSTFSMK
jgi:hypothetical protein